MLLEQPSGYSSNDLDCNDNNADINPDARETCNTIDDDCNGLIDDSALQGPLLQVVQALSCHQILLDGSSASDGEYFRS